MKTVSDEVYNKLLTLRLITEESDDIRNNNVGKSDYSKHFIQPWSIWIDYNLNAWDADIVKRVLRTKEGESRILDYEKIIHICQERIRQIEITSQIESRKIVDEIIEQQIGEF